MHTYTPKTFSIPSLDGISDAQIAAHIKLYEGYVSHVNLIQTEQAKLHEGTDPDDHYAVNELWRRLSFEFNGMRSHEYYFGALEGGPTTFDSKSAVGKAIIDQYGSYDKLVKVLGMISGTRGSGWVMLYYDQHTSQFAINWIDEHHIGYLSSLSLIVALDCWEHAYMVDHDPSGRGAYVDAYLANINWETVDKWFVQASK